MYINHNSLSTKDQQLAGSCAYAAETVHRTYSSRVLRIVMPLIGPYPYILKGPEIFLDVLNNKYV
jgi:hypothetical protein